MAKVKTKKNITKKSSPKKTIVKKITKPKVVKKKIAPKLIPVAPRIIKRPVRKSGTYLSIIIPAYNESKRLPITLVDIDKKLKSMNLSYEIIVVDDGSKDSTPEVVKKFIPIISNLKLLDRGVNKGKGYSVKEGMLAAKGEIRLFMDADNSTTIDQFLKMKPKFDQGAPIVIGSRAIAGAKLDPPQPWYKQILGKSGNLYIQLVAVRGIWDTQCGFKAFTATAAEDIFKRTQTDRWAFDIEALAIARKLGYEIEEIPVHWVNDLRSHVKLTAYLQVLIDTTKIALRLRKEK